MQDIYMKMMGLDRVGNFPEVNQKHLPNQANGLHNAHMIRPFIFAGVLLVAGCLTGCQPPTGVKPVSKDRAAPSVISGQARLPKLDGTGSLELTDFRGKAVILYFMGPWTDSGPASLSWVETGGLEGVEIIPVIVDQRPVADLDQKIMSRLSAVGSFIATPEIVSAVGGVRALPTAVYLNASGEVVKKWQGFVTPAEMAVDIKTASSHEPSTL